MLCSRCNKNEATVYLKQILNNKVSEYHFCPDCARGSELGAAGAGSPIFELLGGGLAGWQETPERRLQRLECSSCGLRYVEFRESGSLGCPTCYESFAAPLKDILKHIHGALLHKGKLPAGASTQVSAKRRAEESAALRKELDAAIKGEKFEEAARLRDRLRSLEG